MGNIHDDVVVPVCAAHCRVVGTSGEVANYRRLLKRGIINSTRLFAAAIIISTPFSRTDFGGIERERNKKKGMKERTRWFLARTVPLPLGDNVVSHVLWSVPCAMVSDCVINRTRNGARVAARTIHDLRDFVCRNLAVASSRRPFFIL